jgi:hypothetical protein
VATITPLEAMLRTEDGGTVSWRENADLGVMLHAASDRHGLSIVGGLPNAEGGLLVIGLGVNGDELGEVHTWRASVADQSRR